MRVITGTARGRKLVTVEGTEVVRPTTDGVKEAIFSAIQFEIEGRTGSVLYRQRGGFHQGGARESEVHRAGGERAGSEHAVFGVPEKHPGGVRHSDTRSALQLQDNSEGASAPC